MQKKRFRIDLTQLSDYCSAFRLLKLIHFTVNGKPPLAGNSNRRMAWQIFDSACNYFLHVDLEEKKINPKHHQQPWLSPGSVADLLIRVVLEMFERTAMM